MTLGRHSIVQWAESAPDDGVDFVPAEEKYRVEMPIGSGGMGEVVLVTDRDLRRQVAMKMIRSDISIGREKRLQFIAEAQATSQLEHPGIPPVHDIGVSSDGRLYFTMKLVQGRTLREVLHDLVLKRREVHRKYTLHKLISILERVCEPLQFSHEKGVVHRDLKPENIMLGDYGEVHVMDWGLARIDQVSSELSEIGAVETVRQDAGIETHDGAVKGSLPYMSPEQVRGEEVDKRSDIYALGCLLYEILTLQGAFDPKDPDLVAKKQSGDAPDIVAVNPRRKVPESLAAVCRKAMSTDPAARHASVQEFALDLRHWLDGRAERDRRHAEAEKLAALGKEAVRAFRRLREEIVAAAADADAAAKRYRSYQPVSEKRPLIEARAKVERLNVELALALAEAQKHLHGALLQEPDNAVARTELVRVWSGQLKDAERRRDKAGIGYARAMVERYADAPVKEEGQLLLRADPPAEVRISRFEERDGVLTPVDERGLGTTPLGPLALPVGSYLCVLKAAGRRDTRYPVRVERGRTWSGEVGLRTDEEIGAEFVHVPAGPFTYGEGDKATTRTLPDFAIQRFPVTFGDYIEFLDALDEQEATERIPRTPGDGPHVEPDGAGSWRVLPILVEGPARAWSESRYGKGFELRLPVIGISFDDAEAYCRWKTEVTGREWRLPTEEEREKAARGVDGRLFAWGDLEDASLGKCKGSREVPAQPEPVGAFPTAVSVYGMGDASGGVWDWTTSWEDERRASRVLRGGSWGAREALLRCSSRSADLPRARVTNVGFRCAHSL